MPNPIPSTDVTDFLDNVKDFDALCNGAGTYTDRFGKARLTVDEFFRRTGYEVPVAFASGIAISRVTQTVTYNGNTYHALATAIPFTTTGTFNPAQWSLIAQNLEPQGITLANLTISSFVSTGIADKSWIHFAGRDTVGDGGGDWFWYSASSTQAADGGTVFAPSGGGRIFRKGWTVLGFNGPVYLEWFGAKGDGVANDCDPFRLAIAASKTIQLREATYLISPTAGSGDLMLYLGTANGNSDRSGMTITGAGVGKSIVKLGNNVGRAPSLFAGATSDVLRNMAFKDFTIDLNGANNLQTSYSDPLRYNAAFYFFCKCEDITFENLRIKNGSGSQLIRVGNDTSAGYGKNIRLLSTVFENFGIGLPGNLQQDCSAAYIQADGIVAQLNRFENADFTFDLARGQTCLELHCDSSTQVFMNTFKYVQLPVLLASSQKPFSNVQIANNSYWQCNYMVSFDPSTYDQKNVKINREVYFSTKVSSSSIVPIGMPGEGAKNREEIELSNCTLTGWGNTNQRTHVFSCIDNYIRSLRIADNIVSGFNGALLYVAGQVMNSGYVDFTIEGNKLDSLGATSGVYPNSPAFVHVETSSGTVNAITIADNTLFNSLSKNYGTFGAFKLSGPISYVNVVNNQNNFDQTYPLVTDAITGSIVKNIQSSIERPVSYRSGFVPLAGNSSVNLFDFSGFTQNDNALLEVDVWMSVGGSASGSALAYKVLVGSSAKVAMQLAKGGTYGNDVIVEFSGSVLRVTSTTGTALSMLVNIGGLSTKPIAWLV